jgi:putative copper resistance protein D
MSEILIHSVPTFVDVVSLAACIGALGCRLWVFPRMPGGNGAVWETLLKSLWRLIPACMIALIVSSAWGLALRAAEMSGQPLGAITSVLPIVLFKTHYGYAWLTRIAALSAMWMMWYAGRGRPGSRGISFMMFCAGAVIAFTRSASSHAADAGDFSPPEIADWLHLMGASLWAGGSFALFIALFSASGNGDLMKAVEGMVARFFKLSPGLLTLIVLTGAFNTWHEVGRFQALWETPYGRVLSAKLALLLMLGILTSPERIARQLARRIRIQAVFGIGVMICAAILTHEVPARHASHQKHGREHVHAVETADVVVDIGTLPANIGTGSPATIVFSVNDRAGEPVQNLTAMHERLLHVIIASSDFSVFAHIHPEDFGELTPEMRESARYAVRYSFPKAGKYIVAVDSAVEGAPFSRHFTVNVSGKPEMGPLRKDLSREKQFGDYRVTLAVSPKHVVAGKVATLRYHVSRGAEPVRDLEPYLSAPMHLAVISSDLGSFIHTHGELPGTPPGGSHDAERHADMSVPDKFGPEIEAHVIFPARGLYEIFSEVKHLGRVITVGFMVEAE